MNVELSEFLEKYGGLRYGLDNINILAKGPTWAFCPRRTDDPLYKEGDPTVGENDEIWGLNSVYMDRPDCDRIFIMHDIRTTAIAEDHQVVPNLNRCGMPVYTPMPVPVLDNNVPFPAVEVLEHFNLAYMTNVINWMMPLAIMMGPKAINLYGADYVYGVDLHEKACNEWWLGVAYGRGININLPPHSALLKPQETKPPTYGYYQDRARPNGIIHLIPEYRENNASIAAEYKVVDAERLKELESAEKKYKNLKKKKGGKKK